VAGGVPARPHGEAAWAAAQGGPSEGGLVNRPRYGAALTSPARGITLGKEVIP
jgi:hypothetical protein